MNNLSKLKEEKENLSRELADSCRHVVDLQYAYKELHEKYIEQRLNFASFLIKKGHAVSMETAMIMTDEIISKKESQQLELPLKMKMENDLY